MKSSVRASLPLTLMSHAQTKAPARNIFVATSETQGRRKNDFCFTDADELVRFTSECDGESIDGRCGCRRSLVGMNSLKATTTFRVVQVPIDEDNLVARLQNYYAKSGFVDLPESEIRIEAQELIRLASAFVPGTILEKRGDQVVARP